MQVNDQDQVNNVIWCAKKFKTKLDDSSYTIWTQFPRLHYQLLYGQWNI